jgi:hypothetical protein
LPDKAILEVCLSPGLLPLYPVDDKVVVVIDVLARYYNNVRGH